MRNTSQTPSVNPQTVGNQNVSAPATSATVTIMPLTITEEGLLRGTDSYQLLRHCGDIFRHSHGSAETYQLSNKAERLAWFISHNWSTPRWQKFLVLAFFFNYKAAMLVSIVAMAGVACLTATGSLPLYDLSEEILDVLNAMRWRKDAPRKQFSVCFEGMHPKEQAWIPDSSPSTTHSDDGTRIATEAARQSIQATAEVYGLNQGGVVGAACGSWAFFVVLLTWHELVGRLGLMRTKCFLDKTCIHQSDPDLTAKGVMNLAGFLGASDGILVIYSELYLTRLWTVFELATVSVALPHMKVRVRPAFLPVYACSLTAVAYLLCIFFSLSRLEAVERRFGASTVYISGALFGAMWLLLSWMGRNMYRKYQGIKETGESFALSKAACKKEEDRALVSRSVEHFMVVSGRSPPTATTAETLDAFDALVHERVPTFLAKSLGRVGMPYRLWMVVLLPLTWTSVDDIGSKAYEGVSVIPEVLDMLAITCIFWPIVGGLNIVVMRQCLHLRGLAEAAFVLLMPMLTLTAPYGLFILVTPKIVSLAERDAEHGVPLQAQMLFLLFQQQFHEVAIYAVAALFTWLLYGDTAAVWQRVSSWLGISTAREPH